MNNKFTFGKYKNKLIVDVAKKNPDYVIWVYENVKTPEHGGVPKELYNKLDETCVLSPYFEEDDYLGVDMWGN